MGYPPFWSFPVLLLQRYQSKPLFGLSSTAIESALLIQILREKIVTMVITLPICKAWARYMPNISIFGLPLNPGPFNIKEHTIITVMADIGLSSSYGVGVAELSKSSNR